MTRIAPTTGICRLDSRTPAGDLTSTDRPRREQATAEHG